MAMISSRSKRDLSRRIRKLRRAADDTRVQTARTASMVSKSVSRYPLAAAILAGAGVLVGAALLHGARAIRT